jgi:hypothetical protein
MSVPVPVWPGHGSAAKWKTIGEAQKSTPDTARLCVIMLVARAALILPLLCLILVWHATSPPGVGAAQVHRVDSGSGALAGQPPRAVPDRPAKHGGTWEDACGPISPMSVPQARHRLPSIASARWRHAAPAKCSLFSSAPARSARAASSSTRRCHEA